MMTSHTGEIELRRSLDGLEMTVIRQRWEQPNITDVSSKVRRELERLEALDGIQGGDEIAITAGSRGIASMPEVLRSIVAAVRERGGKPFIFPAMGSHGGGTAQGQKALLAGLGITEETIGAPVRATMEVVRIGEIEEGVPVYLDAFAAQAAGIIVVNRIKKHTDYDGPLESGLCKMAVIGMGKHKEASAVHQYGTYGLRHYIPKIAQVTFSKAPVLAGLAIIENAWGGVADLVGLHPDEIVAREPRLLMRAKDLCAKIPFHDIDIALVERMGKDISGTGMDCYVIGRKRIIGEPEWPEAPQISSLVVLDLTEASHGNGLGVGLADFTTQRLVDKLDWKAMRTNVMTSGYIERTKLPLVYESAQAALEAAAFRERRTPLDALRMVCFRDTLRLRHLLISPALASQAKGREDLVVEGSVPLRFDEQGGWISPF
ncbi:MAG: DUF2088 domain-containing protein [Chloroflexota bacterium]|nr:DUF2088 domain-containing protein [Chloroflexota bacterium]